jgi:hypothetical protein
MQDRSESDWKEESDHTEDGSGKCMWIEREEEEEHQEEKEVVYPDLVCSFYML